MRRLERGEIPKEAMGLHGLRDLARALGERSLLNFGLPIATFATARGIFDLRLYGAHVSFRAALGPRWTIIVGL
jgi:hypothetical protein